jgi:hypothetical protein
VGGVVGDDQVCGVGGLALGGEGVLCVREADIGVVDLWAVEGRFPAVCEL